MDHFDLYQVDAFSEKVFGGNPAAVCILKEWPSDQVMQNIASEINLSETAFLLSTNNEYKLRWFTPLAEVRMCGHATLATGHILLSEIIPSLESIQFETQSGQLEVKRISKNNYTLSLPEDKLEVVFYEDGFDKTNIPYESVFQGTDDYLFILKNETQVWKAKPNFEGIKNLDKRGLIISAKGDHSDFVSRCFYPALGVNEDPVTGSAHSLLAPYWGNRLGKKNLEATQLSKRRGHLRCLLKDDRVIISGACKTVITGRFYL